MGPCGDPQNGIHMLLFWYIELVVLASTNGIQRVDYTKHSGVVMYSGKYVTCWYSHRVNVPVVAIHHGSTYQTASYSGVPNPNTMAGKSRKNHGGLWRFQAGKIIWLLRTKQSPKWRWILAFPKCRQLWWVNCPSNWKASMWLYHWEWPEVCGPTWLGWNRTKWQTSDVVIWICCIPSLIPGYLSIYLSIYLYLSIYIYLYIYIYIYLYLYLYLSLSISISTSISISIYR